MTSSSRSRGSRTRPSARSLRYIAFLRAINVGGHVIRMEHLRERFQSLGFSNVETFIASGNVIFDTSARDPKALEKKIENDLHTWLGYQVRTFIRSPSEVAEIARYEPFAPAELLAEGDSLYVALLPDPPAPAARDKLLTYRSSTDDLHVHEREVYWLCRKKLSESAFSGARMEKTLGLPATIRNVTTVRRLAMKYSALAVASSERPAR